MLIQIDSNVLFANVDTLGNIVSTTTNGIGSAGKTTLDGDYSSISGFDQLGASHGAVIKGGIGSAMKTMQQLTEQVNWLKEALNSSRLAFSSQNNFVSRGMDIADEGGNVGGEEVVFPNRPDVVYEDFSFPQPVVQKASSIDELAAAFASTNDSEVEEAVETWKSLSEMATETSQDLRNVAAEVGEHNHGAVFDKAVERIGEIAANAESFAANASTMANHVGLMSQLKTMRMSDVLSAQQALSKIEDPMERKVLEEEFLSRLQSAIQSDVGQSVPVIRNLVTMRSTGGNSGQSIATGMETIAGNGKFSHAGLSSASGATLQPATMGQHPDNLGDFAAVNSRAGQSIDPFSLSTQQAGWTSPDFQPSAGGSSGLNPIKAPLNSAHSSMPASAGTFNALAPASAQRVSTHPSSATGLGVTPIGPRATAMATHPSANSKLHNTGLNGTPKIGGSSIAQLGASPQSGVSRSASLGAGGTQSAHSARMSPMMGAPMGAAGSKKRGKTKSVTSSVEEDNNIAALLGESPAVVPGVIGSWVRG
ncbi:hypothetical protein D9B38_08470 [Corynebacterium diphtheriae]|uniref:hypothetical protein n=1 Tax=Corynebacterium diphtheriae TaxID=1717 RepID=UPI00096253D1|nr:hypothetical protein [Corynebacterium diphtheriae]MBG9293457.1 hypothetical protein [Corynebacterium diphtheriae bv. mitis]MBG9316244.1 hypothetical protein [Corynebacterium diphtheriae bv. mitis]OLN18798.1 hypothetical protein BUE68_02160 [Corynebacterium diphtheriae]RKW90604.1 hypothetical protein D9B38_08470 [Corynebacterium diphtheriae]CAB0561625.1 hypothetical protein CIP107523_01651 [Corynebacterium diphtheriae]